MKRITEKAIQIKVREICDMLEIPCAHSVDGGWIPTDRRSDGAVAVDYAPGYGGVQVYSLLESGANASAPDPFFRLLDQRKPMREAATILDGIREGIEAAKN